MPQKTRRQHYVYKHYLDSWADCKNQVKVLDISTGRTFAPNTINVCVESGLYDIGALSPNEVYFLKEIFKDYSLDLRMFDSYEFTTPQDVLLALSLTSSYKYNDDFCRLVDYVLFTGKAKYFFRKKDIDIPGYDSIDIEDIECEIENKGFCPFLEAIKKKDYSIFRENKDFFTVLLAISFQFSRTANMLEKVNSEKLIKEENMAVYHLLCTLMQFNLLVWVKYKITRMENHTEQGFVTGDQPCILYAVREDNDDMDMPCFYYPLTPNIAVTLTGYKGTENIISEKVCSIDDVEYYNGLMKEHCNLLIMQK